MPAASPVVDPLEGEILGGSYRIDQRLAEGGMGDLYGGLQLRLERPVAIKLLAKTFTDNKVARARFFREAQAMARIDSPHVVEILDVLETDTGRPCLVAELLLGEDLQRRLQRDKRLSVEDALALAVQLGEGIDAAHRAGVVHRDIKPSNVYLCGRGPLHAKLIDFGVASLRDAEDADRITRTGAVVGTPAYMAPEQVRGAHGVDERADIYGIGAVLYRALAGKAPYAGPPTQVLAAILEGPPKLLYEVVPELPSEVADLVARAMDPDPRLRFESGAALAEAARRLLGRQGPAPAPRALAFVASSSAAALGGVLGALGAASACAGALGTTEKVAISAAALLAGELARRLQRRVDPRVTLTFLGGFAAMLGVASLADEVVRMLHGARSALPLGVALAVAATGALLYWRRTRPIVPKPHRETAANTA